MLRVLLILTCTRAKQKSNQKQELSFSRNQQHDDDQHSILSTTIGIHHHQPLIISQEPCTSYTCIYVCEDISLSLQPEATRTIKSVHAHATPNDRYKTKME